MVIEQLEETKKDLLDVKIVMENSGILNQKRKMKLTKTALLEP